MVLRYHQDSFLSSQAVQHRRPAARRGLADAPDVGGKFEAGRVVQTGSALHTAIPSEYGAALADLLIATIALW